MLQCSSKADVGKPTKKGTEHVFFDTARQGAGEHNKTITTPPFALIPPLDDGDDQNDGGIPKSSPEPILRLQKCLIRPFYEGDAAAIVKEANNPKIARWMRNTFPQPYSTEDARNWISMATNPAPLLDFAICRTDRNTVIGCIGLKTRDDIHVRTVEVGYWLGEKHWHQGIATEALSAFSQWTFDNFDHVLRIEAEVFEGNEGSARVLEKAGYAFEARKRKAVEKRGLVLDALTYCAFRDGS